MKHTEGEWKWYWELNEDEQPEWRVYIDVSTGITSSICCCPRYATEEEWKANAKFIVRACNNHYKLLEASKNFKELIDSCIKDKDKEESKVIKKHSSYDKLEQAIAKVEGVEK